MKHENQAIVARRWPELARWLEQAPAVGVEALEDAPCTALSIDGIQLASAFRPRAEAELQAQLVPHGSRAATIYGFAQGELARVLLARGELERLEVIMLNPSVARASLERLDHSDWLGDERVALVRARERGELATPFAVSPADLALASEEGRRLADLARLELATPFLRSRLEARAAEDAARAERNRAFVERDAGVRELFGIRPGGRLWVAAAGPSLAEHYALLRRALHPLIAVDAALKPLLAAGIAPDVVVTLDGHAESVRRLFDVRPEALFDSTLVYFPRVATEVLARWPGRRLSAEVRGERAPSAAGQARGELFVSGSVFHAAVDLAVRMGAARVDLFGADFATPRGQSHVAGAALETTFARERASAWVSDGHGRRVQSVPNLVGYLRDFERYVARHPQVVFVNASKSGAAIQGARNADELSA